METKAARLAIGIAVVVGSGVLCLCVPWLAAPVALGGVVIAVLGLSGRLWQRHVPRDVALLLVSLAYLLAAGAWTWASMVEGSSNTSAGQRPPPSSASRASSSLSKPREAVLPPTPPEPTLRQSTRSLCTSNETLVPFVRETVIEITALVDDRQRAMFAVRTNLPSGTRVMAQLRGPGWRGDSSLTIGEECTPTDVFGGDGLPAGRYSAVVRTVVVSAQPEAVREVLGERGVGIRGPLVSRDDGQRYAEARIRFRVGDQAVAEARQHQGAVLRRELAELISAGRQMRGLRQRRSGQLINPRECGDRMRELQGRLRGLRGRANTAGESMLARIVGPALMCASCSREADSFCSSVSRSLRDWDRLHAE